MKRLLIFMLVLCGWGSPALAAPHAITTPAGISVWVVPDKTTPSVTLSFAFRGGIEEDPVATQGRVSLMTSLLTEGTDTLDAVTFQQKLADNSVSLGFSAGREAITGSLRFLIRYQDEAIELARGALYHAAIRDGDLARIQQQALAELNSNASDPSWRLSRLFTQQTFMGTPYANAAHGTPQTIPAITTADIHTAIQHHLVRARLLVVATGAADDTAMGAIVDRLFAELPEGLPWYANRLAMANPDTLWFTPWTESRQTYLMFTSPNVAITAPDYPATLVLNDIFGGSGFNAVIMRELRQKLGVTYGASSGLMGLSAMPLVVGQTSVTADKADDAIALIKSARKDIMKSVTPARIKDSITHIVGSLTNDLTSSSAIASFYLGLRIQDLPMNYPDTLLQQLHAIEEKDFQRAAAKLYTEAALSFTVVGAAPPAGVTKTVNDVWNPNQP